ncbi:hypothetical protein F5Y05DRAFT_411244 [Hypoxylon sp. FL0543]|nr:hypothetical protein F5Y05DRAFT_411244 [Hypoxylon sp. FL0543]
MNAPATMTSSRSFPLFSSFPPELRRMIWREALPDNVEAALFFYREGCWGFRPLRPGDEGYVHDHHYFSIVLEFHHERLDDVQIEVPMAFVNREAREVATAWILEQGFARSPRRNRQYPLFTRRFDPERDALYVPLERWHRFLVEPHKRRFNIDFMNFHLTIKSEVKRIAIPDDLLYRESTTPHEILDHFTKVDTLVVIVNDQTYSRLTPHDVWDFGRNLGEAHSWNAERGAFDFTNTDYIGEMIMPKLVELGKWLAESDVERFEVRPSYALEMRWGRF